MGLRGAGQSVPCLGDSLAIEQMENLLFSPILFEDFANANFASMPLLLLTH